MRFTVGLSWLRHLCSVVWRSGTVPVGLWTGVVVPVFKKGDRRVRSNYRGTTLLSLLGKVYSGVLERRLGPIVEPQLQEHWCGFRPGHRTVDQLFTLSCLHAGSLGICRSTLHVLFGLRLMNGSPGGFYGGCCGWPVVAGHSIPV